MAGFSTAIEVASIALVVVISQSLVQAMNDRSAETNLYVAQITSKFTSAARYDTTSRGFENAAQDGSIPIGANKNTRTPISNVNNTPQASGTGEIQPAMNINKTTYMYNMLFTAVINNKKIPDNHTQKTSTTTSTNSASALDSQSGSSIGRDILEKFNPRPNGSPSDGNNKGKSQQENNIISKYNSQFNRTGG
jgi:hypothetical protein